MGVGAQLRALLDDRGISVAQAASLTGIPASTLHSLCVRGSDSADERVLASLVRNLGAPLGYFLSDAAPEFYFAESGDEAARGPARRDPPEIPPGSPVRDVTRRLVFALDSRYMGVRVTDESMLPRCAPGAVALLDTARTPAPGDAGLFRNKAGLVFRILARDYLLPLNPLFAPLPTEEGSYCLGVVGGALRM